MSKFIIVKEAPEEIGRQEMIITMPDFKEEVAFEAKRTPLEKFTNVNFLRRIMQRIADKWDPTLKPITGFPYSSYQGRLFENIDDLCKIINEMINNHHPQTTREAIKSQIKKRPLNTLVIYFVGPLEFANVFIQEGMSELKENEVEKELGAKPKGIKTKWGTKHTQS